MLLGYFKLELTYEINPNRILACLWVENVMTIKQITDSASEIPDMNSIQATQTGLWQELLAKQNGEGNKIDLHKLAYWEIGCQYIKQVNQTKPL